MNLRGPCTNMFLSHEQQLRAASAVMSHDEDGARRETYSTQNSYHHHRHSPERVDHDALIERSKRNEFGYFECPWSCTNRHIRCVHRFLTATSLAAHYFTAHQQNPSRIYCGACRIRFRTPVDLERHHFTVHVNANTANTTDTTDESMQVDHDTYGQQLR